MLFLKVDGGQIDPNAAWIQVSGGRTFDRNQWTEAIMWFLGGVWREEGHVYRQKITFGTATLYCVDGTVYEVCAPKEDPPADTPLPGTEGELAIGCGEQEVNQGLMSLARGRARSLRICVSPESWLLLWPSGALLQVYTRGLQSFMEVARRYGRPTA